MTETQNTSFAALLESALSEPGKVSEAYTAFHDYSFGNQLLAMSQCLERGITPGPIATFPRWKDRGRFVMKGQKAIVLCQPVTIKKKTDEPTDAPECFTRFIYKPKWFVLSQTDGAEFVNHVPAEWDKATALTALDITEVPFDLMDGNCQGFARQRAVSVSPIAAHALKTLFHELAHIVLGHTAEGELNDDDRTPRNIREVEAESVAMLLCAALNLPGLECSRGYIQHWYREGQTIPEKSAHKIFKATDTILKAGRPAIAEEEQN